MRIKVFKTFLKPQFLGHSLPPKHYLSIFPENAPISVFRMYDYISSEENLQKSNELVIPQDQLFRRDRNSMEMM